MASVEVYLYGQNVGTLLQTKGKYALEWKPQGVQKFGFGSKILSEALPLGLPAQESNIVSFFGGLLPEAQGLKALSRRAECAETDLLGLLKYTTPDLPGAVVIGERQEGEYFPVNDAVIEDKLKSTDRFPLGNIGGGGSLTGYQPKITLARFKDEWYSSTTGATSTHILKPGTAEHEKNLWWEHYCLELARKIGLSEFETSVETFEKTPALVIERFDRTIVAKERVEKIHQEDFSQILGIGWDSDAKFEHNNKASSYKNMAQILKSLPDMSAAQQSLERLMQSLIFNLCIGNTDAHTKNHGLLKPLGAATMTQLYDLFPLALSFEGTKHMALSVNGKNFVGSISLHDIVAEVRSWGAGMQNIEDQVIEFIERLQQLNAELDIPQAGKHLPAYINEVSSRLLGGKSAFPDTHIPFILTKV